MESDFGEIHPVGTDEILNGGLLGRIHCEIFGEVEVVDHELEIDLREHGNGVVGWLGGTTQIDLVVFETHGIESTFGFTFVKFYLNEFGDKASIETDYVTPGVKGRVGGYTFILECLYEVLHVSEFLDVCECVIELLAVVYVCINPLFESFLADFFVGKIDLSTGRGKNLLDVSERTVAHKGTVGLRV